MEKEEWRFIVGFEGYYMVSNMGRIASVRYGKFKIRNTHPWGHGYLHFHTSVNGVRIALSVARCVARAFPEICGEWFEGCTVDHINAVKIDNRACNLRVVSLKENINNPLTIAKKRLYRTDEERKERSRQQHRESYQRCIGYYRNYMAKYNAEHKEYFKEYYKQHPLSEEQKEKNRQRALKYYYDHKKKVG